MNLVIHYEAKQHCMSEPGATLYYAVWDVKRVYNPGGFSQEHVFCMRDQAAKDAELAAVRARVEGALGAGVPGKRLADLMRLAQWQMLSRDARAFRSPTHVLSMRPARSTTMRCARAMPLNPRGTLDKPQREVPSMRPARSTTMRCACAMPLNPGGTLEIPSSEGALGAGVPGKRLADLMRLAQWQMLSRDARAFRSPTHVLSMRPARSTTMRCARAIPLNPRETLEEPY